MPLLDAALFLLGTGDTLADTASVARLPAIVPSENLPSANAVLMATFTVGDQFVSKPFCAWLFVLAAAAPFGFNAPTFLVTALRGAFSVFALYARERLGLSELGYGLLLTTFGIGGLIGTAVAGALSRRDGPVAFGRPRWCGA